MSLSMLHINADTSLHPLKLSVCLELCNVLKSHGREKRGMVFVEMEASDTIRMLKCLKSQVIASLLVSSPTKDQSP